LIASHKAERASDRALLKQVLVGALVVVVVVAVVFYYLGSRGCQAKGGV
jgi:hypothetical protein